MRCASNFAVPNPVPARRINKIKVAGVALLVGFAALLDRKSVV